MVDQDQQDFRLVKKARIKCIGGGIPEWKDFGATPDVYYVATNGADTPAPTNGVTLDRPCKTIRYACEEVEKGARNAHAVYLLERNRTFIAYETAQMGKETNYYTNFLLLVLVLTKLNSQRLAGFAVDVLILDLRRGGNRESRRVSYNERQRKWRLL